MWEICGYSDADHEGDDNTLKNVTVSVVLIKVMVIT